ncbi:MAG: ABC transporter ATP-binding protein [SAR324 cluster bacterium]|nr:ABC transporter ATP-binding protein [SAR324 cluster bacterium]
MILQVHELVKTFATSGMLDTIEVLSGLNFDIEQGETVSIVGQSGSGKSTLLSLMAGLDHPTSGTIKIKGQNLSEMSEEALSKFRAQNIGIVFQQFHLMSHLTALENISLPLELNHDSGAVPKAKEALIQVGLEHRQNHFPHQLSGGECQRVAIARALVVRPALLLADEPTGNLDNKTGEHIADLFFDLVKSTKMTMLFVTHNEHLADRCLRKHLIKEGRFV